MLLAVVKQRTLYTLNGKILMCGSNHKLFSHLKKLIGTVFQQACEIDTILTKTKLFHYSLQAQDFSSLVFPSFKL